MSSSAITRHRPPFHGGSLNGSGGWKRGDGCRGVPRRPARATHLLGMFFALAGVGMLFVAFSSAYVARMGMAPSRGVLHAPALLWVNSAVLLASSVTLELARLSGRKRKEAFQFWIQATLLLGLAFLAGQLTVWRMLAGQGVYLATSAHSSFFYVLTAVHGLHLLGGIAALGYVAFRARHLPGGTQPTAEDTRLGRTAAAAALYWHFMDGLWLYMVLLLFFWR